MKSTIVTAFKKRNIPDNNLEIAVGYWSRVENVEEIIIIHLDNCNLPFNMPSGCEKVRVITIPYRGVFSRPYAINVGIKQARTELVSVVDADVLVNKDHVNVAVSKFQQDPNSYILYGVYLSDIAQHRHNHTTPWESRIVGQHAWSFDGIITAKTEDFHKLKGFNETMLGYGYDDNDMCQRLTNVLGRKQQILLERRNMVIHLPHNQQFHKQYDSIAYNQSMAYHFPYNPEYWGEPTRLPKFNINPHIGIPENDFPRLDL